MDFAADKDALAIAFNNAFDRQIWNQILTPRYSFPAIAFERHRSPPPGDSFRGKLPSPRTWFGVSELTHLCHGPPVFAVMQCDGASFVSTAPIAWFGKTEGGAALKMDARIEPPSWLELESLFGLG
jgi:hypothetical protein